MARLSIAAFYFYLSDFDLAISASAPAIRFLSADLRVLDLTRRKIGMITKTGTTQRPGKPILLSYRFSF